MPVKLKDVRAVQPSKQLLGNVVMPGKLTVVRDVQPPKQFQGNDVTVEGISTVSIVVLPPIASILVMV